eukprot:GHVU01159278.1.p1 GENE.GHVU01159278.1~~GHVU01159278.1.p1  ORF type:complete len:353 (+),score=34.57 GHVU01159278.1:203-1261(+)
MPAWACRRSAGIGSRRQWQKKARVVSFDRPALGFSPPPRDGNVGLGSGAADSRKALPEGQRVEWLRGVDDMATLMHDLLDALELPAGASASGDAHGKRARKLVLVGHSTSGLHARLYCHRYPDEVAALVLVDTASERQLGLAEGKSVYNSYPRVLETEGKLARLRRLERSGLFFLMYWCSGPAFGKMAWQFPALFSLLRLLDALGRSAAVAVRQNIKMLAPHFPASLVPRFIDQQLSPHGMLAMIAEHGSQRTSMEYMRSLHLLKPGLLGTRPLVVITRDPLKGAGGRLYGNAQGDSSREAQHQELQHELARLSTRGRVQVVEGAGHGSLVFVQEDAAVVSRCICEVLDSLD